MRTEWGARVMEKTTVIWPRLLKYWILQDPDDPPTNS